jgi:2,5-diketo-D-gluconate reductase B
MQTLTTQGISYPRLGLGTFGLAGKACRAAVESALAIGYRHIDTAAMYGNEEPIGEAIASSGLPRDQLHVTTKVWYDSLAPQALKRSFDTSLHKLKLDHVDLFLVHWPAPEMDLPAIFETLAALKAEGRTRAIGVCNFTVPLLRKAIDEIGAPIACNQVEYHVLLDQTPVRNYLASKGIPLTAYSPLAKGALADNPTLATIGKKHGATPAQVALKWLLDQDDVAVIPKASRRESQQSNLDALKLTLDDEDRRAIAALPKNKRFVDPSFAPHWDAPIA